MREKQRGKRKKAPRWNPRPITTICTPKGARLIGGSRCTKIVPEHHLFVEKEDNGCDHSHAPLERKHADRRLTRSFQFLRDWGTLGEKKRDVLAGKDWGEYVELNLKEHVFQREMRAAYRHLQVALEETEQE